MPTELRIPPPVRPGAHLRVVSPAMPTLAYVPVRAQRAERALTDRGFTVSHGSRALTISADGMTAGTAGERAADLMDAFADPSVDAILAADAGLGTRDVLEHLDAATIAANPKPFVGYCDNVYLHQYLATEAGISSLYGCTYMIHLGEAEGAFTETLDYLTWALDSDVPLSCTPVPSRTGDRLRLYEPELEALPRPRHTAGGWTWLRPGTGRGAFLGTELTLVPDLVDDFGLALRSAVLFWDVAYHGQDVEPLFERLCDRVDLTALAGMVVGAHPAIAPDDWAHLVDGLLDKFLPGIAYPVVVNSDLSHRHPSWTVPYGEEVVLEAPNRIVFTRRAASC